MNIIIFGTGKIYKEQAFNVRDSVIALVDNDKRKIGTTMDGIRVIAPNDIHNWNYDIIVVMARDKQDIEKQLVRLGVGKDKIWHWRKYLAFSRKKQVVKYKINESHVYLSSGKRVLIASTEMDFSGSVIVALYAAETLLSEGYNVTIIAPSVEKEVVDKFVLKGIEVIEYSILRYAKYDELIKVCAFDYLLANTFTMKTVVENVAGKKPIVWWIHEASNIYNSYIQEFGIGEEENYKKVIIKAVSNVAKNNFNKCYIDILREIMPYGIPKVEIQSSYHTKSKEIKFAIIGGLCENKCQKEVIETFIKLQHCYGSSVKLYVVGNYFNVYGNSLLREYGDNEGIIFTGTLNRKQIFEIYKELDVVICASKEDCLPVVMTEAMMCEKIIICSDGTGTASFIRNGIDGFVFEAGNTTELFNICKYIVDNKEKTCKIGENGKKLFEKNFSADSFKIKLLNALNEAEAII